MTKRLTKEEFIRKAMHKHNGCNYDYSKVEYENTHKKVIIICPKHGEFRMTPHNHLSGQGCPMCKYEKLSLKSRSSKEEFIRKAIKIHGDKYDYSKVAYVNNRTPVLIICPKHGEFLMTPHNHLNGRGCRYCANRNYRYSTEEYIAACKKVHNNFYSYEHTVYETSHREVIITCPIHGDFKQIAADHLNGHGCPKCSMSTLEKSIDQLLANANVCFEREKKFQWLKYKRLMKLDFYLPLYNVAIECQGLQHFKPLEAFDGKISFDERVKMDLHKFQKCQEHNLKIFYFCREEDKPKSYFSDIYCNEDELLEEIKKYDIEQRHKRTLQACEDSVGGSNQVSTAYG